jgi:hydrogenase expression/formation protein HypE
MSDSTILLSHGSGGRRMHRLVSETITRILGGTALRGLPDAASLTVANTSIAFTTDSYVVQPLEFPGGDIGKLAVAGTVNDLAVVGAQPLFLSCGLIIEEGMSISDLERLLTSMRSTADEAGVEIVTGDTKVVRCGEADGIYINTSGIGVMRTNRSSLGVKLEAGDAVLVNGTLGDHGAAVMAARSGVDADLSSDCAPLNGLIASLLDGCPGVKFVRDATRGGVATVLNEIVEDEDFGIRIEAKKIPISDSVRGFCETLGLDPLYVANEGKVVIVVAAQHAESAIESLRSHPLGAGATQIGQVTHDTDGMVVMDTAVGGGRIVTMLSGDQLPRIC